MVVPRHAHDADRRRRGHRVQLRRERSSGRRGRAPGRARGSRSRRGSGSRRHADCPSIVQHPSTFSPLRRRCLRDLVDTWHPSIGGVILMIAAARFEEARASADCVVDSTRSARNLAEAAWHGRSLVGKRRRAARIHEHPELAFEEHETAKRVQAFLGTARHSLPRRDRRDGHRRDARGGKPGPTVAIRADMDALPDRANRTACRSRRRSPGKMHCVRPRRAHGDRARRRRGAVGHARRARRTRDVHLPARRGDADRRARRCSTPARSTSQPDAILGFHNWPQLATGTVGWHPDAVMASSDAFDVTIRGAAGMARIRTLPSTRSSAPRTSSARCRRS